MSQKKPDPKVEELILEFAVRLAELSQSAETDLKTWMLLRAYPDALVVDGGGCVCDHCRQYLIGQTLGALKDYMFNPPTEEDNALPAGHERH